MVDKLYEYKGSRASSSTKTISIKIKRPQNH